MTKSKLKAKYLLDINLLLALAWPQHQFHSPAHRWFRKNGSKGWATCAITQLGFIRLSSNKRFTDQAVLPMEAACMMEEIAALPQHSYLSELPPLSSSSSCARIIGHKQVTDAYLCQVAHSFDLLLATFDRRLDSILPDSVELLKV